MSKPTKKSKTKKTTEAKAADKTKPDAQEKEDNASVDASDDEIAPDTVEFFDSHNSSFLASANLETPALYSDKKKRRRNKKPSDAEASYEQKPREQKQWEVTDQSLPAKSRTGEIIAPPQTIKPKAGQEKPEEENQGLKSKRKAKKDERRALKRQKRKEQRQDAAGVVKVYDPTKQLLVDCETNEDKRLLISESAAKILASPETQHLLFTVFFELAKDEEEEIRQLAVGTAALLIKDIIPGYRIRDVLEIDNEELQLSKQVKEIQTFERTVVTLYRQILGLLDREVARSPAKMAPFLCGLVKVAHHFNYSKRLIARVTKLAVHKNEEVANQCVEALLEVLRGDMTLEATKDIVEAVGQLVKAQSQNKKQRTTIGDGMTAAVIDLLAAAHLDRSKDARQHEQVGQDVDDLELAREIRAGRIYKDSKMLVQAEAKILTEEVVVYCRVLRTRHLQSRETLRATLRGLAKRTHNVNVELMLEIIEELRGLVDLSVKNDPITVLAALNCAFQLLQGPGGAINTDMAWLSEAMIDVIPLCVAEMHRSANASPWPATVEADARELQVERAILDELERESVAHGLFTCIEASLACSHLHGVIRASLQPTAELAVNLLNAAQCADPWVANSILHKLRWLFERYPKLKIICEHEGGLFGVGGAMDKPISIFWQLHSMKWHISPLQQAALNAFVAQTADVKPEKGIAPLTLQRNDNTKASNRWTSELVNETRALLTVPRTKGQAHAWPVMPKGTHPVAPAILVKKGQSKIAPITSDIARRICSE
mmetsp:Transcript_9143/g.21936  ORF Transcript_9143/g.21936 Transcript_9143/m.21936 type:complete len:773 (-) Transcript_9143:134-2452(-)